jgi:hypothetical protein
MVKTAAILAIIGTLWVTPAVAQNKSGMDAGTPTNPNSATSPSGPATSSDTKATNGGDTKSTNGTKDGHSTRHRTKTSRNKGCPAGQTRESANAPCTPLSQNQNPTK